jgi:hypothetical protein
MAYTKPPPAAVVSLYVPPLIWSDTAPGAASTPASFGDEGGSAVDVVVGVGVGDGSLEVDGAVPVGGVPSPPPVALLLQAIVVAITKGATRPRTDSRKSTANLQGRSVFGVCARARIALSKKMIVARAFRRAPARRR